MKNQTLGYIIQIGNKYLTGTGKYTDWNTDINKATIFKTMPTPTKVEDLFTSPLDKAKKENGEIKIHSLILGPTINYA